MRSLRYGGIYALPDGTKVVVAEEKSDEGDKTKGGDEQKGGAEGAGKQGDEK